MITQDQIKRWQAEARASCSLFAGRYSSGGVGDVYVCIARQWQDALCQPELNPNELRAVIAEAECFEYRSDIAFYGFINDMRAIYHDLWEDFLTRNAQRDTSSDQ